MVFWGGANSIKLGPTAQADEVGLEPLPGSA